MSGPPSPLVLASASPRRSAILESLALAHEVLPSDVDEGELAGESPVQHAERLAGAKAGAVALLRPDAWILGGDTVVIVDGESLGKPRDEEHAVEMLLRLSGRRHQVASALALRAPARELAAASEERGGTWSDVEVTEVDFRVCDRRSAEAYVATGEPMDKAGAYAIQGFGAALVERIRGDYTAVVGLPVPLLMRLMEVAGRPFRFPGDSRRSEVSSGG